MNLMKTFIDLLLEQLSRPCGDYVLSVDVATYCLVHMLVTSIRVSRGRQSKSWSPSLHCLLGVVGSSGNTHCSCCGWLAARGSGANRRVRGCCLQRKHAATQRDRETERVMAGAKRAPHQAYTHRQSQIQSQSPSWLLSSGTASLAAAPLE